MSAAPVLELSSALRTPPHNIEAEKSVLGSVFIKPAVFDELGGALQVDDFFVPVHREIFEAMLALDKRRHAIDVIAVGDELKTRGLLSRLEGGEGYLLSLANSVPTAENAMHYARIVREKSSLRRLIVACAEVQASAYGDVGDVSGFVEEAARKLDHVVARAAPAFVAASELVTRLAKAGDPLSTQLETLDQNCRSGFRAGRRVFLAGAPGAGKTTLAVWWALAWALAGACVAVLAADESAADLLVRFGQMLGLDRDAIEAGDPDTLARLRAELEEIPTLLLLDGDDGATIEDAVAAVRKIAGDRTAAIVVDGIQTARAAGSDDAEGPRARVDAVLAALRRASQLELVVVATSEMARAAYRSRDPADRIDDLAAAKESGGIEYAAQTLLVLRSVPERVGEVDVAIPKNRGGGREPLRLLIDFQRSRVQEIYRAKDGDAPDPDAELRADMARVRDVLRGSPGVPGNDALLAKLGFGKTRGRAAIRTMEARGEIRIEHGAGKARRLYLSADPPESPEPAPESPGELFAVDPPESPAPYRGAGHGATQRKGSRGGAESPGGEP